MHPEDEVSGGRAVSSPASRPRDGEAGTCQQKRNRGNGLPFAARIPNAETVAALNEPTHNLKRFESVDDLFADIVPGKDPRITEETME